ncbi:Caspase domain-containing protein [Rivularia sp. PCC 7116]|nr:Caspase domain-containing protein [Rivularia sp. PCC 7116]
MANKIYALLVGIDEYAPESGVSLLKGCVNDIKAIEKYLEVATQHKISDDNGNKKTWELVTQKLTNESATRQAVIDGFEQHLSKADSGDVVFFYYAGHI